jgi:hypothetical protein
MSRSTWRSAELLGIETEETGAVISFDRCLKDNAVLRSRARELTRALLQLLGRKGRATLAPDRTAIRLAYEPDAELVLPAVHRSIDAIAARPCTPDCIQRILGIRSMELARWTEDGRLRPIGSALAKRGSEETCLIYAAADIAALASTPDVIESWRYQDALARRPFQAQAALINAHG